MANLCWWYYISKLTEFADTMFFVLRKKDSQISFLHLYHHSLTPIETWVLVKFIAGKFLQHFTNLVKIIGEQKKSRLSTFYKNKIRLEPAAYPEFFFGGVRLYII